MTARVGVSPGAPLDVLVGERGVPAPERRRARRAGGGGGGGGVGGGGGGGGGGASVVSTGSTASVVVERVAAAATMATEAVAVCSALMAVPAQTAAVAAQPPEGEAWDSARLLRSVVVGAVSVRAVRAQARSAVPESLVSAAVAAGDPPRRLSVPRGVTAGPEPVSAVRDSRAAAVLVVPAAGRAGTAGPVRALLPTPLAAVAAAVSVSAVAAWARNDAGGGGGGYGAGGGAGIAAGSVIGGGGGGSSFVVAGATNVSSAASARTDDGQVTISYDPGTDSCPASPTSTAPISAVKWAEIHWIAITDFDRSRTPSAQN